MPVDFSQYFDEAERKLKSELLTARTTLGHSGNKGTRAEVAFRSFLKNHLSRRFDVGHGEVIDANGNKSGGREGAGQLDVIVVDEGHPSFVDIQNPALYVIEGVTAAGEIKAALKLSDVEQVVAKAARFKSLHAIVGAGDLTFAAPEDMERFYERRPYFLFAFESATPLASFYERMKEVERSMSLPDVGHLDGIFILGRGAIINLGAGNGGLVSVNPDGSRHSGWMQVDRPPLIALISWINEVMPYITRMSPVMRKYLIRSVVEIEAELGL